MGHARALLPLARSLQKEAAEHIVLHGLSVRETEQLVRRLQQSEENGAGAGSGSGSKNKNRASDPNIRELQDNLSARLGAKVAIQHHTTGQGRLVIHYHSVAELDGILEHLK